VHKRGQLVYKRCVFRPQLMLLDASVWMVLDYLVRDRPQQSLAP
jgi:hypothetical protein